MTPALPEAFETGRRIQFIGKHLLAHRPLEGLQHGSRTPVFTKLGLKCCLPPTALSRAVLIKSTPDVIAVSCHTPVIITVSCLQVTATL